MSLRGACGARPRGSYARGPMFHVTNATRWVTYDAWSHQWLSNFSKIVVRLKFFQNSRHMLDFWNFLTVFTNLLSGFLSTILSIFRVSSCPFWYLVRRTFAMNWNGNRWVIVQALNLTTVEHTRKGLERVVAHSAKRQCNLMGWNFTASLPIPLQQYRYFPSFIPSASFPASSSRPFHATFRALHSISSFFSFTFASRIPRSTKECKCLPLGIINLFSSFQSLFVRPPTQALRRVRAFDWLLLVFSFCGSCFKL